MLELSILWCCLVCWAVSLSASVSVLCQSPSISLSLLLWGNSRTHSLSLMLAQKQQGENSSSDARGAIFHLDQFLHINEMWLGLDSSKPRLLCLHYWNSLPQFFSPDLHSPPPFCFSCNHLNESSMKTYSDNSIGHNWCVKYTQSLLIKVGVSLHTTAPVCL